MPGFIYIRDTHLGRHILERAVVLVAIKRVVAAFRAVGHINIRPSVAIEIHNRDRSSHGGHFRHDVIQLVIERGTLVNEIHSGGVRNLLEVKTMPLQCRLQIEPGLGDLSPGSHSLDKERAHHHGHKKYRQNYSC